MSILKDLIAQRDALEVQITELRDAEYADAVLRVRALISEYQLSASDVFNSARKAKSERVSSKVAAKYLDPASGKTWSGRGLAPKWLAGKDKAEFLIA